jgi:hypothetical protein
MTYPQPHSAGPAAHLHYADSEKSVPAHFVRTWKRGEIPEMVMSTSSGPKDYTANRIFLAFQEVDAKYITMYVARGVPFLLYTLEDGRVIDASGREVAAVSFLDQLTVTEASKAITFLKALKDGEQ